MCNIPTKPIFAPKNLASAAKSCKVFAEDFQWKYLVKAKLKNLKKLLEKQEWNPLKNSIAEICEFEYMAKPWKKNRKFKAIRHIKEYVQADFMGTI